MRVIMHNSPGLSTSGAGVATGLSTVLGGERGKAEVGCSGGASDA